MNVILNADTLKTTAASGGSATISITVPSDTPPGGYPVQVVGVTSGKTASSFLDVFSTSGDNAKKFTVSISPTTLPPLQQGSGPTDNSNMTITVLTSAPVCSKTRAFLLEKNIYIKEL